MESKRVFRYVEIAEWMEDLISSGAYKSGERLPSIRDLSLRYHVSINTAREAYALLERRRLVRAIPQSGYYASPRGASLSLSVPDVQEMDPECVSICSIYGALQKSSLSCEDRSGLAVATLSRSLWPTGLLQRFATDAVRLYPADSFDYQIAPGYGPLREQIAIHSLSGGSCTQPDSVIVTSGCQESIYLALESLTAPGDTVAVESPVYFGILDMLALFRLKVLEIPCTPPDGIDLGALSFALDHYSIAAVLSIANFHNPTGCLMPDEKKSELVRMLEERGVPLIEDDVYGDLAFSDDSGSGNRERPRSCKSFDAVGNVLYCSSFSKTLSPGLRVGWIDAGKSHDRVERSKSLMNLGASSISQVTASLFLRDGNFPRYLRQLRTRLSSNMKELRASVLRHFPEGTAVTSPAGGLVLWVELSNNASSMDLYRKALDQAIMIAPGRVFSLLPRFETRFRLNAGVWEPGTDSVIRDLARIAQSLS